MTLRDFLRLLLRRWYVFAAVLAIMAVLTVLFARDGGSFNSRTIVTFTFPSARVLAAYNGISNEGVIAFAGTVAAQVNRDKLAPDYSRDDAPFYGAGVREGVLVGLRDEGSQWGPTFGSAVIEVQVVGRTEQWVRDRQEDVLGQIVAIAASEQNIGIKADHRIEVHVEPLTKQIEHIVPSRSAQVLAVGAMSLAGLLLSVWVATMLDRRSTTKRTHK